jgi:Ca-activated chloride channel family protein
VVGAVKKILAPAADSDELCTVRLRYKLPGENASVPFNVTVSDRDLPWPNASVDFKFATAVAVFADALKNQAADSDLALALRLAREGKGADHDHYRGEFIRLIETAKELRSH